ncbi:D-galactonate dehydratase (plasmid) [Sulfitobacter sp. THAF37]|nr:D-galactonate dehydratase [Sulfitobacter sp. THAF37]
MGTSSKIRGMEIIHVPMSGAGGIARWNPIFVRITTEDGLTGIGEVGLAYGVGAASAIGMLEALGEAFVIGADAMAHEALWERIYRRSFWAEGGGPVVIGAMSAIDTALWDIKGKALGLPVWRLLGGAAARPLRCYASQIQFDWSETGRKDLTNPSAYRDAGTRAVADGYDCVKVDPVMIGKEGKIDDNVRGMFTAAELDLYVRRMEAVREGVGPSTGIILELHSLPSLSGARQLIEACRHVGLYLVEEPVHYANPSAQIHLSETFPETRFAAGERLYTRWGAEPYLSSNAIDMLQPDFGLVGGITEGKKVCDLAHLYDITVQGHVCGSPVATAVALHVETAIPNFEIHEHHVYARQPANRDLCTIDLQPKDGVMSAPDAPGLGIDLVDTALDAANARRVTVG